jgi:glycine/serine hydroxymethyltransferase
MSLEHLKQTDAEVYDLVIAEERYQADTIRLIPSENYA